MSRRRILPCTLCGQPSSIITNMGRICEICYLKNTNLARKSGITKTMAKTMRNKLRKRQNPPTTDQSSNLHPTGISTSTGIISSVSSNSHDEFCLVEDDLLGSLDHNYSQTESTQNDQSSQARISSSDKNNEIDLNIQTSTQTNEIQDELVQTSTQTNEIQDELVQI